MKTSHSSRSTFKACKRKYHWSYVVGIQQDHKPKALRMGSAWSDGLEYGPDAITDFYGDQLYTAPEWALGEISHELAILKALRATYPFDIQEQREVPFVHNEPTYQDRGQLDGLKVVDGRYIIIENKLYARFGNMEIEKLEYDEQVTSYVAALVDGDVEGHEDGTVPGNIDVYYNVTLKPALRRKVSETEKAFTQRCVDDIIARPIHYHRQEVISRSEDELQDFRIRRDKHAMDLIYEEKMDVWERSPSACFDYGQCPYLKICRSPKTDDTPEGYHQKEERT